MKTNFMQLLSGSALLLLMSGAAASDAAEENVHDGRASVYKNLHSESLEEVSTPDAILKNTAENVAPTKIWRVLEHGEKVECLDCIPAVAKLVYNAHPRTREISVWWLRRRVFGVFGPGQVYSQVVDTLQDQDAPEHRRAYAAEALGEFLTLSGVKFLSTAVTGDPSARVRESAVRALERLNSTGADGELAAALGDEDESVRLSALKASIRVHAFTDIGSVAELISDDSALVRRRAAQNLGVMRAGDAVAGLMALVTEDEDASVRAEAVIALGKIADPAARDVVREARDDADPLVQDAANIALRAL